MRFAWLSSSVGMSERLKIVRSPVRSRPQPPLKSFLKVGKRIGLNENKVECFEG